MGGVDCEVTQAHQFALLEYEEVGFVVDQGGTTPAGNTQDLNLQRTLASTPKYTMVPPPGVVSVADFTDLQTYL